MTHPGTVRPTNQDHFGLPGHNSNSEKEACCVRLEREGAWALVADGMGGHRAGSYASKVAIDFLSQRLPSLRASRELPELLTRANKRVHEAMYSEEGELGMGTTIVGLWLRRKSISIFNVGDSRAYIFRRGELIQVSEDHTPEGNSNQEYRSHRLTQSIGGTFHRIDPMPHISNMATEPGDSILLCSDGLTDLVSDDRISTIISNIEGDPANGLVNAALHAGGRDNITAVLLRI